MRWASVGAVVLLLVGLSLHGSRAETVVWDGGEGTWTDANWDGGLDALAVFGMENGSRGDREIIIGGASQVVYLAGPLGVDKDFTLESRDGPCSVMVKEGASLELRSEDTEDAGGLWTEWDADLILDQGTLKRTFGDGELGTTQTSGAFMWGSWNTGELPDSEINISLVNGGRIENHGMLMFGAWNEHGPGLKVTVTINDGSIDLTGGDTFILNDEASQDADMHFYYGEVNDTEEPKGESYVINFTGPGSITVDHAGIRVHHIGAEYGSWVHEAKSYEDLWAEGILQADGKSGLDGLDFATYFGVTGTAGEDDYVLTSKSVGILGDFNKNGTLDAADLDLHAIAMVSGQNPADYDLNDDSLVNFSDRLVWLHDLKKTWVGDSDLNGLFNSADFVVAFQAGKYEVPGANATWVQGDWNGDLTFTSADFVAAFADGGYEAGPRPAAVSAVPEPSSVALVLIGLAGLLRCAPPRLTSLSLFRITVDDGPAASAGPFSLRGSGFRGDCPHSVPSHSVP